MPTCNEGASCMRPMHMLWMLPHSLGPGLRAWLSPAARDAPGLCMQRPTAPWLPLLQATRTAPALDRTHGRPLQPAALHVSHRCRSQPLSACPAPAAPFPSDPCRAVPCRALPALPYPALLRQPRRTVTSRTLPALACPPCLGCHQAPRHSGPGRGALRPHGSRSHRPYTRWRCRRGRRKPWVGKASPPEGRV
jgi:hypothetical protein